MLIFYDHEVDWTLLGHTPIGLGRYISLLVSRVWSAYTSCSF